MNHAENSEIGVERRRTASGHLRPILCRKILIVALLHLRFFSVGSAKSDPNLRANSNVLLLYRPLVPMTLPGTSWSFNRKVLTMPMASSMMR